MLHSSIWFILGREPLLSYAEIYRFFSTAELQYAPPILKAQLTEPLPDNFIARLGGTVKIARELQEKLAISELESVLLDHLRSQSGKIIFGLSWYGSVKKPSDLETLGKKLKKILQEEERSVRYIPNREAILSSVTVEKNGLTRRGAELIIHDLGNGQLSLAQTTAVQPFEAFSNRDFGRPGRDDESGMLPPKLALLMLNLSRAKTNDTVLDPFCGSGTILTEALLQGFTKLIGTDISEKALADTLKNYAWTKERLNTRPDAGATDLNTFLCDVAKLADHIAPESVDAIVTEPYLGKPLRGNEPKEALEQQARELAVIYATALRAMASVLRPGGTIVMIIPRFRYRNDWITLPLDRNVSAYGLTVDPLLPDHASLLYARPTQRVGREIWRLVKK